MHEGGAAARRAWRGLGGAWQADLIREASSSGAAKTGGGVSAGVSNGWSAARYTVGTYDKKSCYKKSKGTFVVDG